MSPWQWMGIIQASQASQSLGGAVKEALCTLGVYPQEWSELRLLRPRAVPGTAALHSPLCILMPRQRRQRQIHSLAATFPPTRAKTRHSTATYVQYSISSSWKGIGGGTCIPDSRGLGLLPSIGTLAEFLSTLRSIGADMGRASL